MSSGHQGPILMLTLVSNTVILGYLGYEGLTLYNEIDNYLYNRFLVNPRK